MLTTQQGIQHTLHIFRLHIVRLEGKVDGNIVDLQCGGAGARFCHAAAAIGAESTGGGGSARRRGAGCIISVVVRWRCLAFVDVGGVHGCIVFACALVGVSWCCVKLSLGVAFLWLFTMGWRVFKNTITFRLQYVSIYLNTYYLHSYLNFL